MDVLQAQTSVRDIRSGIQITGTLTGTPAPWLWLLLIVLSRTRLKV